MKANAKLESFEQVVSDGDLSKLRQILLEQSPVERAAIAKKAISWLKKASKGQVRERGNGSYGWEYEYGEDTLAVSVNATLITASAEQLGKIEWPVHLRNLFDWKLLEEFRPDGMRNFGDVLMKQSINFFPDVRRMMAIGLCQKPTSQEYYVGLIGCPYTVYGGSDNLKALLLKESDLQQDVWKLFEIEGDQENSLAAVDKYSNEATNWCNTLLALCREGVLVRGRLLDSSLEALGRDFIQFRAGWFSRFHESLNPTDEERIERKEQYLHLLGSSVPPTVSFAIKALKRVDAKSPIPGDDLSRHISPALTAKSKGTVVAALSLLERAIKRDKHLKKEGNEYCLLLANCLYHEVPEVEKKAFTIIRKYGDPQDSLLRAAVEDALDVVAASLRKEILEWLGDSGPAPAEPQVTDHQSIAYSQNPDAFLKWPFSSLEALKPPSGMEDALAKAAFCLENPREIYEFALVLDFFARSSNVFDEEDFEKRTGALKKRAKKFYQADYYSIPLYHRMIAAFIFAYLSPEDDPKLLDGEAFPTDRAQLGVLKSLMTEVLSRRNKGQTLPLLSTPSHEGGWLSAEVLLGRIAAYEGAGVEPDRNDLSLSLVRLWKADLRNTLEKLEPAGDSFSIMVLKYIAGLTEKVELPYEDRWLLSLAEYLKHESLEKRPEFKSGFLSVGGEPYESALWLYRSMPALREHFFRANKKAAIDGVAWMEVSDLRIVPCFELLLDSGAPLGPHSYSLMGMGLINADPQCTALAREAVISAVEEQRLSVDDFSPFIREALHSKLIKPKRLADSLREISRAGATHGDVARRVLEQCFTGLENGLSSPRGLSFLLELYVELLAESGRKLDNGETIEYLKAVKTGGKTGKLITQLLS